MRLHPAAAIVLISAAPLLAADGEQTTAAPKPRLDLYGDPIPAGANARLGTVRFRHVGSGWDMGVGFAAGGESLISVAEDDAIRYWDPRSGRPLRTVRAGQRNIRGIAFSGDRQLIATLAFDFDSEKRQTFRTLKLWNITSGKPVSSISWIDPGGAETFAVAVVPDGTTLVTGSTDGTLRFWGRTSGVELLKYKLPSGRINAIAAAPDGKSIAVAGRQGVHLWDWASGNEPNQLAGGNRRGLAFSPDGRLLAVGSDGGSEIELWSVAEQRKLRSPAAAGRSYITAVAFSPDGRLLAAGDHDSRSILLWDAASGERVRTIPTAPDTPKSLDFSPDGRRLAAGVSNGIVRIWSVETGQEAATDPEGHLANVMDVAFSPQGTAVTASDDGTVRIWDTSSGRHLQTLRHEYWVRGMAVSPDGTLIVSSSLDDTVRLWEAATGKEIYRLAGHGRTGGRRAVAFAPDGKRFASWGDDMYLRVWDVLAGKALEEHAIRPSGVEIPDRDDSGAFSGEEMWRWGLKGAAFSPDSSSFVLAHNRTLYVFDVQSGKELRTLSAGIRAADLAVSPDGRFLLVSGSGQPTRTKLASGSTRISSAENHFVKLLDFETGKELWALPLPDGGAGPVAFSPDGKLMAAGLRGPHGERGQIRIWDAETRKEIGTIRDVPAIRWQRTLVFSPDGTRLACGQGDTTVLIWGLERLQQKRTAPAVEK